MSRARHDTARPRPHLTAEDRRAEIQRWLEAGLRHHPAERFAEAETAYRRLLALDPLHPDGLLLLGTLAWQTGRRDLALDLIGQAVPVALDTAPYQANLGKMLLLLGQAEAALPCLHCSVTLDATVAEAQKNLGSALQRLGQIEEAARCYRTALELEPNFAEAHNSLGNVFHEQGRWDQAEACYRHALSLRPDYAEALGNLGSALRRQGRLEEAADCLARAIALSPGLDLAHFTLAEVRREQERVEEAVACYQTALALNPDRDIAHHNLGAMFMRLARPTEAVSCFRAAIRLRPDFPEAHHNQSMAQLTLGEMPAGWQEHEWRWHVAPLAGARRDFAQPQWGGEDAAGRTLLIHAEQGYGDTLQFCRYASLAKDRGLRVILEAPAALIRLLHGLRGVDRLVTTGEALPDFDLHCPMLSLPLAFATTVTTIPCDTPYLHADAAEAAAWAARLAPTIGAGPRIGLAWAGNRRSHWPAAAEIDRRRSLAFERLAPLLAVPALQFYSLQMPDTAGAAAAPLIDCMAEMHDFADTAALIANMDLVISVDTAIAHLAGALGRPVCLLDRFDHCWRWLAGQRDSPWYPTMRIYRQPNPGDWDSVLAELVADMHVLAAGWHAAWQEQAGAAQVD
ncbi:MAG TPA: tetratricopeptide repeat protein [Acetobacteraceae bacterium]|nr:tetratricopeptide repeat protein [Acetobacteraceae bacterium]